MTGECPVCGESRELTPFDAVPVLIGHDIEVPGDQHYRCAGSGKTPVERRKQIVNQAAGQLLEWERALRSPVPSEDT